MYCLPEGHPEARALDGGEIDHQRFEFLVVQHKALAGGDFGIVDVLSDFQGLRLHPLAVFPVAAIRGDLADVDFRVEVRGEGLAVVAVVAVHDVEVMDFREVVLGVVGGEHVRRAGIETAAQQRHQARLLEALSVGPLPGILELRHVPRLIVGGVEVMHARFQAGVHDRKVLVGQGHIDDEFGTKFADQGGEFGHVVRVHRRRGESGLALREVFPNLCDDLVALAYRAAGEQHFREDAVVLGALLGDDVTDAARSDNHDLAHRGSV